MSASGYAIRGGVAGRERLSLLSRVLGPSTDALIAMSGLPPGAICLDIGCGGGDVSFSLAKAVGPTGRVLGVDIDEVKLELARSEARQRGLLNVAFEAHDVTAWIADELFDVVYARFLLTHLRDPVAMLSAIRRQLRPGGTLIVEDIDYRGHFAAPECAVFHRYVALYTDLARRRGGDPEIGPRLPSLLRTAGFTHVQATMTQPVALQGGEDEGIKCLVCVTLESIADAASKEGLATTDELRAMIDELYAFARDPNTVIGGPRVFQVWGVS
ncbi:MAG: methyltransferase domain-containing protein [bacterium]